MGVAEGCCNSDGDGGEVSQAGLRVGLSLCFSTLFNNCPICLRKGILEDIVSLLLLICVNVHV